MYNRALTLLLPSIGLAATRLFQNKYFTPNETPSHPERLVNAREEILEYAPPEQDFAVDDHKLLISQLKSASGLPNNLAVAEKCPQIAVPSPNILQAIVGMVRKHGNVTLYDHSAQDAHHHFYVHGERGPTYEDITKKTGLSKPKVKQMIANGTFFPMLFAFGMLGGGATIETTPSRQDVKMTLTPPGDPIVMSNVVGQTYMSIPREPKSDFNFLVNSMLAQTRRGHALTGTVLHMMVADEIGINFIWIGAGGGTPFIGGKLNNYLACSRTTGIWPNLAINFNQLLTSKESMHMAHRLFSADVPDSEKTELMVALRKYSAKNEKWVPYLMSFIASGADLVGLRYGSSALGAIQGKWDQIKE